MRSQLFVNRKLRKKIEKDIKKRQVIEDKINKLQQRKEENTQEIEEDLTAFYEQVDADTVVSTLQYYGGQKTRKRTTVVEEIQKRYSDENLLIEDTLTLIDWYEEMCDYYNDKI